MTGIVCSMVGATFSVAAAAQVLRAKKSITAIGNAQISTAQSKFGSASAFFDGTGDWLKVSTNSDFSYGTSDFTIEWWQYVTQIAAGDVLLDQRSNSTSATPTLYYRDGTNLTYFANGTDCIVGGSITLNTWQHIALSRSSGSTKIFINGSQSGSTFSDNINYIQGGNLTIFGRFELDYSPSGYIDEFRVSNSARYTANFIPPTTPFVNDANTVLLIHADGTNGSTFFEDDNGVRSQKGISALGNAQIDTAQSKFGGASALFDGTGDYLSIAPTTDLAFGTNDFTIEFWMRLNTVTGIHIIYDSRVSGAYSSNVPVIYMDGATLKYYMAADRITSGTLSTGVWYHVAVSRQGSSTKMFIDGTQAGSTFTDSTNLIADTTVTLGIHKAAGAGNGYDYNGWLDEVRVSNSARYTTTFTPSTTPFQNDANTLLLMHMDGIDASTVFRDDNGAVPAVAYYSNVLTNIDADPPSTFKIYNCGYLGDDANANPVFCWAYRDVSDYNQKIVAFTVDKSLGTLTIGTPATVGSLDAYNNAYSEINLVTENMHATNRTRSTSAAGAVSYWYPDDKCRVHAFTVDLSTLAVTVGTAVSSTGTMNAGETAITYLGGNQYTVSGRNSSGSSGHSTQRWSRSGTTLTSQATGTTVGAGDVPQDGVGFTINGSDYRLALNIYNGSFQGNEFVSAHWYSGTFYSTKTAKASLFGGDSPTNSRNFIVNLNSDNKVALIRADSGLGNIKAQVISITWGTGNPTHSVGTSLTLTGSDQSPIGFAPGMGDDEFIYIYESSSTIRYRKISASGTTLTEGMEVNTGLSSTNLSGPSKFTIANSSSGIYCVGLFDDSTTAYPKVISFKIQ